MMRRRTNLESVRKNQSSAARASCHTHAPVIRGMILGLILLAPAAQSLAAAPAAPANCRARPDYGDSSIIVEWDNVAGETGFKLLRAEAAGGPFVEISGGIAADTLTYTDPGRSATVEYFYKVIAFNGDGDSGDSNVFQQNVKIIWPNTTAKQLLHNWNETIGRAAVDGYHQGCDIQQSGGAQNTIVIPRGGVISRVGSGGADDNFFFTQVKIGATTLHDGFNHMDGANAAAMSVSLTDYVRAGQTAGLIGSSHFTGATVDFVDHVHFDIYTDPNAVTSSNSHPLKIFPPDSEKDPQDPNRPMQFDHASPADGTVLYHRQGAPVATYETLPLGNDPATAEDEGDIDIHVEIADDMNAGTGTTQVATSISYWIEGRPCDGSPPKVKDATAPYKLYVWDSVWFGGAPAVDWRDIMDENQNLNGGISHGGVNYPGTWDNYKHAIITNTNDTDGARTHVQDDQYWNTNAKDDSSAATVAHANFAGKPDATKAAEARFPDGKYKVHVIMTDLVGSKSETIADVTVENFPPAVKSKSPPPGGDGTCIVMIEFSEEMNKPSVEAAITWEKVGGGPVAYTVTWDAAGCKITLTPVDKLMGGDYKVKVNADVAKDLVGGPPANTGAFLDSEFGKAAHNGTAEGDPIDSVEWTFPCPAACCLEDGTCVMKTQAECLAMGGIFHPEVNCTPTGACCLPDGTCIQTILECCEDVQGCYLGDFTVCPTLGVCCLPNGTCSLTTEPFCLGIGGDWVKIPCWLPNGNFWSIKIKTRYKPLNSFYGAWFHPAGNCWFRWCCWDQLDCFRRIDLYVYKTARGRLFGTRRCIPLTGWRLVGSLPAGWTLVRQTWEPDEEVIEGPIGPPPDLPIFFPNNLAGSMGAGQEPIHSDDGGATSGPGSNFTAAFQDARNELDLIQPGVGAPPPPTGTFQEMLQDMAPGYCNAAAALQPLIDEIGQVLLLEPDPMLADMQFDVQVMQNALTQICGQFNTGMPLDPLPYFDMSNASNALAGRLMTMPETNERFQNAAEHLQLMARAFDFAAGFVAANMFDFFDDLHERDQFLWTQVSGFPNELHQFALAMDWHARINVPVPVPPPGPPPPPPFSSWSPEDQGEAHVQVQDRDQVYSGVFLDEYKERMSDGGKLIIRRMDRLDGVVHEAVPLRVWFKYPRHLSRVVDIPPGDGLNLPVPTLIAGDVNGDNCVDAADEAQVVADQGQGGPFAAVVPPSDVDGDGDVDPVDIQIVQLNLGACGQAIDDCDENGVNDLTDIGLGDAQDCNGNGIPDFCDIRDGFSEDVNATTVPDECECLTCPGDGNGDGNVDLLDVGQMVADLLTGTPSPCLDMNGDGGLDGLDIQMFIAAYMAGPACPL